MNLKSKVVHRYRSTGLGKKILFILLFVSLFQIGITLLISWRLSSSIITEQTGQLIEEGLEQNANNVQVSLDRLGSVLQEIYTNTDYVDDLKIINSWDGEEYYLSKHSLETKLRDIITRNHEIMGIALVGRYGDESFYDRVTMSSRNSYCFDLDLKNSDLVKMAFAQKDSVYSSLLARNDPEYGEHTYFYIAHQLTDFNHYKRGALGCVILCIDEEIFRSAYTQGGGETNLSFLTDCYGNILSFPRKGYDRVNLFGGRTDPIGEESVEELKEQARIFIKEIGLFQAKNLAVNAASIQEGRFFLVNIQDLGYSLRKLRYLLLMSCLVALLVGEICFFVVYYISRDTDQAMKKILDAMNEANQGNLDSKIEIEGSDEFAQISDHFNVMLSAIRKSGEQERESLIREKNAEIRSLEAQINPHFLYNTLDAINWRAIEAQQFSISQMITRLAQLLRYSIHNSNEIVTLKTELEFLKKYVYLQQERFDYSFDCTIEMDERAEGCHIHKLLLQPIVENTIIHGFSGLEKPGEIHISIQEREDERIEIEISDNGKGMSEELVEELNHYDYRRSRIETSIGVRNVIARVKMYYGEQGEICFSSGQEGTSVTVVIPQE